MSRRNYRNNLDFIEAGFIACWHNSQDLMKAAKVLLDTSLHAIALSTSVLALEEIGKLFCIDGLLFARNDDHKAEVFAKSLKSHSMKLSALELFPLLLAHIASADPRYRKEPRFNQALVNSITDLKERGNHVMSLLEGGDFHGLDRWKQSGFYSQPHGNSFITPAEAIDPKVAEAVYTLAWRALSTLDFLLKDGNLDRYIASALARRSKFTEEEHRRIETVAEHVFADIFPARLLPRKK